MWRATFYCERGTTTSTARQDLNKRTKKGKTTGVIITGMIITYITSPCGTTGTFDRYTLDNVKKYAEAHTGYFIVQSRYKSETDRIHFGQVERRNSICMSLTDRRVVVQTACQQANQWTLVASLQTCTVV